MGVSTAMLFLKEKFMILLRFYPKTSLELHMCFYIFIVLFGISCFDTGVRNGRLVYLYPKRGIIVPIVVGLCKFKYLNIYFACLSFPQVIIYFYCR